jgi:hypothetical protein
MLWDVIVRLGALASGTTVLAGLLINESIETHVLSAVVFAVVPAAAALVLGATLVCLVRLLGSLVAATPFVAGWPIRRAALLVLRLTGAPTRLRTYSPACMARP